MPYIVVEKLPNGNEMKVINNKGSLSLHGPAKKFLSKESAKEIAAMWAEINANCRLPGKMFVRKVD